MPVAWEPFKKRLKLVVKVVESVVSAIWPDALSEQMRVLYIVL